MLSPVPLFRLKRLEFPNGFAIGGGSDEGFSLSPSIDVIGKRSTKDSPELTGLNTINTAVELGVAAKYQMGNFRVLGAVRQGLGGHKGVRAELGADVIVKPDGSVDVPWRSAPELRQLQVYQHLFRRHRRGSVGTLPSHDSIGRSLQRRFGSGCSFPG